MAADSINVLVRNLAGFMRGLRRLNFPLGTRELSVAIQALEAVDVRDEDEVRRVLELVWCKSVHDIFWFRLAFKQWTLLARRPDLAGVPVETYLASLARQRRQDGTLSNPSWLPAGADVESLPSGIPISHGASRREILSQMRLERLTDEEMGWLMALYRPRRPLTMASYLGTPALRGRTWSPQETMRQGREGSEWIRLYFERHRPQPLALTVLLDLSGSMASFQRPMLQFMHGMMRHERGLCVYGFSTRLTPLTAALKRFHVDRALAEISFSTPDRGGGTRIGQSLETLWRQHRGHGISARSTIVLISDGFEEGDGRSLDRWAGRLARYTSGRLLWWNPLGAPDPQELATPSVVALAAHSLYTAIPDFRTLARAWAALDRQPAL